MLHGGHTRSRPRERQSKNASPTFCEGIWGIRGRSSLRVVDILLRPHQAGGREPPCSWNGGQAILPLLSSDSSSTKWDGSYLTGTRADGTVQCVRSPPPPPFWDPVAGLLCHFFPFGVRIRFPATTPSLRSTLPRHLLDFLGEVLGHDATFLLFLLVFACKGEKGHMSAPLRPLGLHFSGLGLGSESWAHPPRPRVASGLISRPRCLSLP